ncbi:hypothetical protein P7K49_005767 [Saguinus oedipus]|uniref:Uncharacterized protein n=1 Tax=Saguinus oedipus TaxID=9490 RepID=A0ABQ9W0H6_SAGOE|nr:hypothetical protein P7K49_005767 [Saguinus oedipus]
MAHHQEILGPGSSAGEPWKGHEPFPRKALGKVLGQRMHGGPSQAHIMDNARVLRAQQGPGQPSDWAVQPDMAQHRGQRRPHLPPAAGTVPSHRAAAFRGPRAGTNSSCGKELPTDPGAAEQLAKGRVPASPPEGWRLSGRLRPGWAPSFSLHEYL